MKALIAIDLQNDFCAGGGLTVPDGDAVIEPINVLLGRFPVRVLTQDWHPAGHHSFASSHSDRKPFDRIELTYGEQTLWPDHCVRGSSGAGFHTRLKVDLADLIVRKGFRREIDSYSAFFENDHKTATGLAGYLRERSVEELVLAGLAFDFCVGWSALDARELGFEVTVVEDACRAIDADGSAAAMRQELHESGCRLVTFEDFTREA